MQTSIATVKSLGQSSVGGVSIQFTTDGGDFWAYPDKGVNTMSITTGQVLQIEWFKKPSKDGTKNYTILKSFKPVAPSGGASFTTQTAPVSPAPVYTKPAQQTGLNGVSEPGLRFISNVVGLAVQAGTIKDSAALKVWTLAAKEALISLNDPSV